VCRVVAVAREYGDRGREVVVVVGVGVGLVAMVLAGQGERDGG
jgi:hypothetical protein